MNNTSAPASPLLPQRSTNRKSNGGGGGALVLGGGNLQQNRARADSLNERPFVAVKRAYEFRKYNDSHVSDPESSSPAPRQRRESFTYLSISPLRPFVHR
jgi:hypothetical protein